MGDQMVYTMLRSVATCGRECVVSPRVCRRRDERTGKGATYRCDARGRLERHFVMVPARDQRLQHAEYG